MALSPGESIRFDYNGKCQSTVLGPGKYRIQCYGAKGRNGSNGGYVQGYIRLKKNTTLYAYCGQSPTTYAGGWNGGSNCSNSGGNGGGGRTDIALGGTDGSTTWNSTTHLQKILLSAKGGNGGNYTYTTSTTGQQTLKSGSASYSNRNGVLVYTWKPTVATTCTFYSTSHTSDPYGHVYVNGSLLQSNDDGNGNLDFKITFTAQAGNTYTFYVGAYSSAGSANYVIVANVPTSATIAGGTGAEANYYYTANTVGSYPYGTCALDAEIYIESASVSSSNSSANTHGYVIITRVAVAITYTNCSGSVSQVYGGETVILNADKIKTVNSRPQGFVMYIVSLSSLLYLHIVQSNFIVPNNIWYDFTIEAIYAENLRYNSNFYKNSNPGHIYDFDKLFNLK